MRLLLVLFLFVNNIICFGQVSKYYNSFYDKEFIIESLNEKILIEMEDSICCSVTDVDKMFYALMDIKNKYTNWFDIALNNNLENIVYEKSMDIVFPTIRIGKIVEGGATFFSWGKLYTDRICAKFTIEKEKFYVTIYVFNGIIDSKLRFSSPKDFEMFLCSFENVKTNRVKVEELFK